MIIIVSTVRSNPEYLQHDAKFNLGFLQDPKRFNVSMTRAKSLLVVVGNGNILCLDPSWKDWIRDAYENNCCVGVDQGLIESIESETKHAEVDEYDSEDEYLLPTEAG